MRWRIRNGCATDCKKNCRKGQYFSFDAIVASVIFILTFISFLSYWFSVKSALDSKDEELSREAARITDGMFTPAFFTDSSGKNVVKRSTLLELPSGEAELKRTFNSPYSLFIVVTTEKGTEILRKGGDPENMKTANVAKVRRIFVLYVNDSYQIPAALDLYLYN